MQWSRPVRALWIEMMKLCPSTSSLWSRPVRALWIEISVIPVSQLPCHVEAREGLVD